MLELHELTKTYGNGVRALDGVSLEIGEGLYGLLGPNGAGKSTLMRTIATLQEPDGGRVLLDGRDAHADRRTHRRSLGYLPQEHGVYPGISALDLLDHLAVLKGLADRRERRAQVEALLARTHLWADRRRAVASFSGGMRRRFGIAQALLGAPRLVVVDEPTAGLDPEERRRLHDLLLETGERAIVLLSTHIVADVEELCPRLAILEAGRVLVSGEPTELVSRLEGRLWKKTVARPELATLEETQEVLSTRLREGRIEVVVEAAAPPDETFGPLRPDLEFVYFAMVKASRAAAPRAAA